MKKIPVCIMLLVFLLNTLGYFPLLELNKFLVKKEIESWMFSNPSRLVVIRVENPECDPEFQRIHQGEFRYKGKMYDIAAEHKDGRSTIFICLNDQKEEHLLKGLRESCDHRFTGLWWDHVIKIAFPISFNFQCSSITKDLLITELSEHISSIAIPVRIPPPK